MTGTLLFFHDHNATHTGKWAVQLDAEPRPVQVLPSKLVHLEDITFPDLFQRPPDTSSR